MFPNSGPLTMYCRLPFCGRGAGFADGCPFDMHVCVLAMQEAQELGSALGYLLLYLELAAAYLGAPLLNQVGLTANRHVMRRLDRRLGQTLRPPEKLSAVCNWCVHKEIPAVVRGLLEWSKRSALRSDVPSTRGFKPRSP